jgi:GT2 family glycosyltransferase
MQNKIETFSYKKYEIDYYGYTSNGKKPDVAIIVLNRNLPTETDRLCASIIETTQAPYDLFVTESGSEKHKLSRFCSFHFVDSYAVNTGLRIPKGLNTSVELINQINPEQYKFYWFLTNDVVLKDKTDYVETAKGIFDQYSSVGIIEPCYQPEEYYTLNYHASARKPCLRQLNNRAKYTESITNKKFSIIPFPIIRSLFFSRNLVDDLGYLVDEANWRNWGNDEDLGYRAWKNGWWVTTTPYCSIWEDMFLTTRLSSETKTEDADTFKTQAELDMHRFLKAKYHTNIRDFRVMVYEAMLAHLDEFDKHDIDIAHCVYGGAKSIYRLIQDTRR